MLGPQQGQRVDLLELLQFKLNTPVIQESIRSVWIEIILKTKTCIPPVTQSYQTWRQDIEAPIVSIEVSIERPSVAGM